ncbi:MAG: hypothetical protein J0M36_02385 [Caulobacterales bacterium]|nr:hypothetical protein [Caulobacterales bacterium]
MTYDFEAILACARKELASHGFDEVHSNVKVIRYQHRATRQVVYIDRDGKPDQKKVSFAFLPRDLTAFAGLEGVAKAPTGKHSSNYTVFPKTLSRKGEMQHEGGRVVLKFASNYTSIIEEIKRGA